MYDHLQNKISNFGKKKKIYFNPVLKIKVEGLEDAYSLYMHHEFSSGGVPKVLEVKRHPHCSMYYEWL